MKSHPDSQHTTTAAPDAFVAAFRAAVTGFGLDAPVSSDSGIDGLGRAGDSLFWISLGEIDFPTTRLPHGQLKCNVIWYWLPARQQLSCLLRPVTGATLLPEALALRIVNQLNATTFDHATAIWKQDENGAVVVASSIVMSPGALDAALMLRLLDGVRLVAASLSERLLAATP